MLCNLNRKYVKDKKNEVINEPTLLYLQIKRLMTMSSIFHLINLSLSSIKNPAQFLMEIRSRRNRLEMYAQLCLSF